jgi:hypothetical protein
MTVMVCTDNWQLPVIFLSQFFHIIENTLAMMEM